MSLPITLHILTQKPVVQVIEPSTAQGLTRLAVDNIHIDAQPEHLLDIAEQIATGIAAMRGR